MNKLEKLKNSITDIEQRVFIKFGVILGQSSGIIHQGLVNSVGPRAYKLNTVKNLVTKLKRGENCVEDNRGGDTSNPLKKEKVIGELKKFLDQTRAWTCRELSLRLNSSKDTVNRYLTEELHMKKLLSKWVPHLLTEEQKEHRILACKNNLEQLSKHKSLISRTLAIDETWLSLDMVPQRDQSRTWRKKNENKPEIVHRKNCQRKRMLILAMDSKMVVYWKLLGNRQTVNSEVYKNFLIELLEVWLTKKAFKSPIILHDNARPHKSNLIKEFFKEKKILTWVHPPYSPDISPPDFNCFGQLKRILGRNIYTNWSQLQVGLEGAINELNAKGYMNGVQKLPEKWRKVIDIEGSYL
jgi:[histone H3]-lysine36 N-dimethyltransferase SETMAR